MKHPLIESLTELTSLGLIVAMIGFWAAVGAGG